MVSFTTEIDKINPSGVIGLPPQILLNYGVESPYVDVLTMKTVMGSMPIAWIQPAYPELDDSSSGLHLFRLNFTKGATKYASNLSSVGLTATRGIRIAYLNETSISESWQNEFGPSQMEDSVNSMGGDLTSDMAMASGNKNLSGMMGDLQNKQANGVLPNAAVGIMRALEGVKSAGIGAAGWLSGVKGISGAVQKLRAGSKVDFPSIWKNSSYQASYSLTVRLYNPYPYNFDAYKQWIVFPLMRIIALALPLAEDSDTTYTQCVACAVECPGLWRLKAGYIASLEVIKGGDANDISWLQHPNMVDVRINFGEMYGVMTGSESGVDNPSLKDYYDNLLNEPSIDLNLYSTTVEETETTPSATSNDTTETLNPTASSRIADNLQEIGNNLDAQSSDPEVLTNEESITTASESVTGSTESATSTALGTYEAAVIVADFLV